MRDKERRPNIIGLWEHLESVDLAISQFRCVVVRNRNAVCRRCAQACASGCIHVEAGVLKLDTAKCIGCGTCATACLVGAITPMMPDDDQLLAACDAACAKVGGIAIIACEEAFAQEFGQASERGRGVFDRDSTVGVNCLGRVDETLVLQLIEHGAREVFLVHGDCASCPKSCGSDMAHVVIETVNLLLRAWKSPERVQLSDRFPADAFPNDAHAEGSRAKGIFATSLKAVMKSSANTRDLGFDVASTSGIAEVRESPESIASGRFSGDSRERKGVGRRARKSSRMRLEASVTISSEVERVGGDGTLPHFVPSRRRELLDILARKGEPDVVSLRTRLWGRVEIDGQRCESCRMCAVFCPTGALSRFDDADGAFGLAHTASLCVQCRTCESVCRAHALRVDDEVRADSLLQGRVERMPMKPVACEKRGAHSAVNSIRHLIDSPYVYER